MFARQPAATAVALVFLLASCWGAVHGLRAAAAQAVYRQAKFATAKQDRQTVLRLCESAQRLYPHNYRLSILGAERAFYSHPATPEEAAELRRIATRWCDTGLGQNCHKVQLRLIKTRLMQADSPAAALAYWERYVDWNFWVPHHHAVLVELYAQTGDFEQAQRSLRWVKRSQNHYARARGHLQRAWEWEKAPPELPGMP